MLKKYILPVCLLLQLHQTMAQSTGTSTAASTTTTTSTTTATTTPSTNPFINGTQGNFHVKRTHAYQVDRTQSRTHTDGPSQTVVDDVNLRTDGTYEKFDLFWLPPATPGSDWNKNAAPWTPVNEVTAVNPVGFELENKDAIARYSCAIYGYGRALPVAVVKNSQYRESGFDGFEDYDFGECVNDHFSFKEPDSESEVLNISEVTSHSGRRSIQVKAGVVLTVKKLLNECDDNTYVK